MSCLRSFFAPWAQADEFSYVPSLLFPINWQKEGKNKIHCHSSPLLAVSMTNGGMRPEILLRAFSRTTSHVRKEEEEGGREGAIRKSCSFSPSFRTYVRALLPFSRRRRPSKGRTRERPGSRRLKSPFYGRTEGGGENNNLTRGASQMNSL